MTKSYLSKAVKSPSKRGQHQPHFDSKGRQLRTTVKWVIAGMDTPKYGETLHDT